MKSSNQDNIKYIIYTGTKYKYRSQIENFISYSEVNELNVVNICTNKELNKLTTALKNGSAQGIVVIGISCIPSSLLSLVESNHIRSIKTLND